MTRISSEFVTPSLGSFMLAGKTGAGCLFTKEVIREGEYQHPVTPWDEPLRADREYLERVAANTNEAIAHGIDIPVPDTHNDKVADNKGFVRRAFVGEADDGSPALFTDVEILDTDILPKIGQTVRSVSGWFSPTGDGEWRPDGDRLRHVALTQYPVASRQANFVALDADGGVDSAQIKAPVLVPVLKENPPVKLNDTQIAALKALGIETDNLDEGTVDKLLDLAGKPPVKVEVEKEVTVPTEKALSVDVEKTPYFKDFRTERSKRLDAEVEDAEKAGKLDKNGGEAFRKLLGIDHAYALDDTGSAAAADAAEAARALVKSLPDNATVPLEKLADVSNVTESPKAKPDQIDPKKLAAEALDAAGMRKSTD